MNSSWRSVLPLAKHNRLTKGEYVQMGKDLLFLERGSVRLAHQNIEGTEKVLWYIREGCIFGEAAFFDSVPDETYCICATACSVYAFSPANVKRISVERPELLLNLFQSMGRKLNMMCCQASSLYLDSVLVRVCKFLSPRIVLGSSPLTANINMPQQEMASLLGVHRISLYRVLRQQEERGLFGPMRNNSITILQPNDFYALVGM
jgi:CRP-like cAMP-binding protein